jgi:hypothetical protein
MKNGTRYTCSNTKVFVEGVTDLPQAHLLGPTVCTVLSVLLILHAVSEPPEHICATRLLWGSFRRKHDKI